MIGRLNRQIAIAALLLPAMNYATGMSSPQRGKAPKPAKQPAAPSAKTYLITLAQSQITILLRQEGLVSRLHPNHHVAVRTFSGRVQLPPGDESKASVEVEAEAGSLMNVDKDMKDFERSEFQKILHGSVLESARFPNIKFRSASVSNIQPAGEGHSFTLNADLTLHGVTRRVAVPVNVVIKEGQLRATGEAKLRQSDFGMKPYTGGLGTIKIGDEVKVSFSIVATAS
ncbi:MAG TPA: YceI family protein [Blastocatellia bacterium]|nr:YceI family protein [Blastocatellia bacterium]